MTDLLDQATQLAEELLDGAVHLSFLQHEKRAGKATQEDVNAVVADLEYLRRSLRITVDRAEAVIASATIPEAVESSTLAEVRARLKGRVSE